MKSSNRIYKRIAAIAILIFVGYSVIGFGLVAFNKFEIGDFLIWFGVLGGLVSVVGLLSFFQKSTTKEDLQELQLDTLREIADSSRKLENLEEVREATVNDINTLEIQRQQMEVMIRKASLSIFLQEQYKLYVNKVLEQIRSNDDLHGNLNQLSNVHEQLEALEEEISKDENVDLLLEILRQAKQRSEESQIKTTIEFGSPFLNIIARVAENAADVVKVFFTR